MPNQPLNNGVGYRGFQESDSGASEFNIIEFLVNAFTGKMATVLLGQVKACTNNGGLSEVGYVDFQPLVKLVDGAGNTFAPGTIYKCPYLRVQGGKNAVIVDPEPGDIGIVLFASADVSVVIANRDSISGSTAKDSSV